MVLRHCLMEIGEAIDGPQASSYGDTVGEAIDGPQASSYGDR